MESIFNDLFLSIYRYLGFGIVFGTVTMLALPEIKRKGISPVLRVFFNELIHNSAYRWKFIFFIYLFMVLSRTLICRDIWECPWENVIGEWGIYTAEGKLNTEGLLNIMMFGPLTLFGLLGFHLYVESRYDIISIGFVLLMLKSSLAFSLVIEFCQLFLRLGTFQLSDMAQNTFGGTIGAILYLAMRKLKNVGLEKENK